MILLDTSGVFAFLDPKDARHAAAKAVMADSTPPRLLSPFVLAELDYLVATRIGQRAEQLLLEDVANGAYALEPFGREDVSRARAVIHAYSDLNVGLADASIVVLAERFRCRDLLTLDRHFEVLRADGAAFRLLPA